MRILMLAVTFAALAVSGCGGGGKAVLVKACVDDGENKKECECIAGDLQKNLDKEVFAAMVLSVQGKEQEADAIMEGLSMEKQFSVSEGAYSAMMKCGTDLG